MEGKKRGRPKRVPHPDRVSTELLLMEESVRSMRAAQEQARLKFECELLEQKKTVLDARKTLTQALPDAARLIVQLQNYDTILDKDEYATMRLKADMAMFNLRSHGIEEIKKDDKGPAVIINITQEHAQKVIAHAGY